MSARVVETAIGACHDKDSLDCADLHNTAGARYFELNRLGDCRREWEETKRIRSKLLEPNHIGSEFCVLLLGLYMLMLPPQQLLRFLITLGILNWQRGTATMLSSTTSKLWRCGKKVAMVLLSN
jgi:hypothetical protein